MTADTPSPTPTRRVLRVIAVNIGLIAAGLVVVELIFGGWVFGENYGTLVIPKSFTRVFDVDALYGGGKILYKRDKHGLRGEYADPGKIDILTIGGSTTNEIFVDEKKTWSAVLGQAFAEAGRPMTVVNAGVDGQTTLGNIKDFELWFPKIPGLKPRYVLALLGINDSTMVAAGGDPTDKGFRKSKQDRMIDRLRPFKQYLMNNSVLYALFRNVRGILRARDAKLIHSSTGYNGADWRPPARPPDVERRARDLADGLARYADRVRELARRIRALGAKPIFVTQHRPSYRVHDGHVLVRAGADGVRDLEQYETLMAVNRETMKVCRTLRAICVDLASELFFEDGDHYDTVHTTPKGSAKIGRYLFGKLAPLIASR